MPGDRVDFLDRRRHEVPSNKTQVVCGAEIEARASEGAPPLMKGGLRNRSPAAAKPWEP
jgi:hypothetical protein